MIEIVKVVAAESIGGNRLRIRFSNGSTGVHDFTDMISQNGSMIEPLRNPDHFKRVFVSMGVLAWPNGFDIDAIALHREMRNAGELTASAAE